MHWFDDFFLLRWLDVAQQKRHYSKLNFTARCTEICMEVFSSTVSNRQRRIVTENGYCSSSSSKITDNASSSHQHTNYVYTEVTAQSLCRGWDGINSEWENRVLREMQRNHKLLITPLPLEPARMLWMPVQYHCIVAIVVLWRSA